MRLDWTVRSSARHWPFSCPADSGAPGLAFSNSASRGCHFDRNGRSSWLSIVTARCSTVWPPDTSTEGRLSFSVSLVVAKRPYSELSRAAELADEHVRGSRQVAATLSAHHAHLFAAEITDDELARLQAEQAQPGPYGAGGSERTWPEIATFGEIRAKRLVDWSTLGMIADVLLDAATDGAMTDG